MRPRLCSMAFFSLCCLTCNQALARAKPENDPIILPELTTQAIITRVITTKDYENDKGARDAMNQLRELARTKPKLLAAQVVYRESIVADEKEGWNIFAIMMETAKWGSELRKGLTPLLETKDKKMLRSVAGWLGYIDVGPRKDPDESVMAYRGLLLSKKDAPPPGLVNYVFGLSLGRAMLLFGEINSPTPKFGDFPRDLMWSDHVINTVKWRLLNRFVQDGDLDKARAELDKLSKHEGWYARRYVVEVLRSVPPLGTPEMVERLKRDSNPLVADRAKQPLK